MGTSNVFIATLKFIAIEILWDVIYFPAWWYSKGLVRVFNYCLSSASLHLRRRLALGIWLKSMFKPMYGDYTKEGRIISFFMRLVLLVWKLALAAIWLLLLLALFIIWIILPLLAVYYVAYQVSGVPFLFFK